MKKYSLILLSLLLPALAAASAWDTEYKAVEAKISAPTFADRSFDITKYGASTEASAAKNQRPSPPPSPRAPRPEGAAW